MSDQDVIRALDGARRAGWAKYYDRKEYAEVLENDLVVTMATLIHTRWDADLPVTRIWQMIEFLNINPEWLYKRLSEYLESDEMAWFRTGETK